MQVDYGWWPRSPGGQGVRVRVTYDEPSRVLFAHHPDRPRRIADEPLAVGLDRCAVDEVMAGWFDHCDTEGLDWVRERVER